MGWAEAERSVDIKGYRGALGLVLDPSVPFAQLREDLRRMVKEHSAHQFFKGSEILLRPGRAVSDDEFQTIQEILKEGDLHLKSLPEPPPSSSEPPPEVQTQLSLPTLEELVEVDVPEESQPGFSLHEGLQAQPALMVTQTLRSGQKVHSAQSVILFGDLNAGAEIVSEGNVIVLGVVRGVVHAGASGDPQAVVIGLRLTPTQLRIGGLFSQPPAESGLSLTCGPEKAFVENGQIIIESPPYELTELQTLLQDARRHASRGRGMGRGGLPLVTLGNLRV